jgi:subtilisin family serine protease
MDARYGSLIGPLVEDYLMPLHSLLGRLSWLLLLLSLTSALSAAGPASSPQEAEGPSVAVLSRRQHLHRLGVDRWHEAGQRGKGVKVAVLDSGFAGYKRQLGRALPQQVVARSFRADHNLEARDSQHGVLCAEVVHALAPDAELLLANWEPSQPEQFLEAVRWAIRQGARIISCSIIMPTWSDGEGGGPIHAELTRLLGDGSRMGDVLFFACAGNTADRHWSGTFTDDGRGYHSWGQGIDNPLLPWSEGRVSIEMCAEQHADLELLVQESFTDREVQSCRLQYGEHRTAVVKFTPEPGKSYQVRVRATGPRTQGRFHLFALGASLRYARSRSSISFPGDGPEVVTLGAVEGDGRRAPYSSCGPNSPRPKPDLVAVVPFASQFRSRAFTGTSAATPQAAGLAALLCARHPDWSANRVKRSLCESAQDLGPPGHDWETGHGLIRLPLHSSERGALAP